MHSSRAAKRSAKPAMKSEPEIARLSVGAGDLAAASVQSPFPQYGTDVDEEKVAALAAAVDDLTSQDAELRRFCSPLTLKARCRSS